MAFAIAAATPTMPISPTPLMPSGLILSSGSSTKITLMSCTSAFTGTRSRTSAKAICSWRSPPVKTAVIGRPWPSARRWILVENPPWDRPSASSGASPPDGAGPASAGGVLVGPNDRGIDKVQIPVDLAPRVRLSLKGAEDAVPNPRSAPAVEAARHRSDRAIALRQVAPGGAGAVDPQHAAHHAAVIMIGSARAGLLRRQQRLKSLPLCVRHI